MPTGKVKWYDVEKGFGFLSKDDGGDVFVRSSALPEGVATLKAGTRVEFGIAAGRRGDQALQVRVLDATPSVSQAQAQARRKSPEDMVVIVEDVMQLLDNISNSLRRGHYPDKAMGNKVAQVLRVIASELES